ncbi:MAG: 23S rRNA (uracil(1939)-C(5))-methyltransferase RlmD [Ruminococcaceae bacterium]|nr:23S rRNA (uracil(1939)-C(5))-methyltransferase RlmD [Oscillospiraceae bacterium]
MKKNDIFTVNITSVGSGGEGVCRVDNMAVFVPFAVAGDEAEIKIVKVNKNYAFGRLEKILTPSPSRVCPKCFSFGKCGGCALQSTDYKTQLEIKRQRVKDALERIGGFKDVDVAECFGSDPFYEYRNKAQYPVADVNGKAETGFYAPRSHRLVKMDDCSLTDSDSKIILNTVIDFLNENGIRAYDEETKKGTVRHVYTRHGDGEIIAVIVSASKILPKKEELVEKLLKAPLKRKLSGIVYNYNPLPNNVILGDTHKILYGKSYIHDTLCGIDFKIDYKSFYQINKKTTENLYTKAIELLAPSPDDTVLDLYCGIGTITLCAAKHCGKVIGVEVVEEAILDARENALSNGISNAEFHVGTAEEVCPALVKNGLTASAVIVDPPRKGCDAVLLNTLIELSPSRIVYVSCDPATLARDAKFLCENGYTLDTAYPFDQFPQTSHVETVILLSRKDVHERIKFDLNIEELNRTSQSK